MRLSLGGAAQAHLSWLLAANLKPASAQEAPDLPASDCWEGEFTFARCCLSSGMSMSGDPACWHGAYDFLRCCQSQPLLSEADLRHIKQHANGSYGPLDPLQCRPVTRQPGNHASRESPALGDQFWHDLRAAMTLRPWSDVKPYYSLWMHHSNVEGLAACPLGVISMLLLVLHLHTLMTGTGADASGQSWANHHAFLWAESALRLFLSAGGAGIWPRVLQSGWPLPVLLSRLGEAPWSGVDMPDQSLCITPPNLDAPSFDSVFSAALTGTSGEKSCALTEVLKMCYFAERFIPAPISAHGEVVVQSALDHGASMLHEVLLAAERPLLVLVSAEKRAGVLGQFELVQRGRPLKIPMSSMLGHGPGVVQHRIMLPALRPPFDLEQAFGMRLFAKSEVISDGIRHALTPVCGLATFVQMVARMAHRAVQEGCPKASHLSRCRLTVLEGGANIGSCFLWAAAALRAAGAFLVSVAIEPMLEAAELFELSVIDNRMGDHIHVERRALTAPGVESAILQYIPGRHGQASLDAHSHSGCGQGSAPGPVRDSCEEEAVEATTVDEAWIRRFGPDFQMDVLKLNVNGEEVNTLRGARQLLSKRRLCVVMMHVFKVQYAVRNDLDALWSMGKAMLAQAMQTSINASPQIGGSEVSTALVRVRELASSLFDLVVKEAGMELLLRVEPAVVQLKRHEAVHIPLTSSEQLYRVLAARDQELHSVAATLRRRLLRSRGRRKEHVLPFRIKHAISQAYLIARTPYTFQRCRYVAHTQLPAK